VWCETLPYPELPAALPLLAARKIDLLLAVRPWELAAIAEVVRRARGEGVVVGVWPMIADEDGRWANTRSSDKFIAFTDALLMEVPFVDELAIDLEPPFEQLAKWVRGRPARMKVRDFRDARDDLAAATRRWHASHRITTAVLPMLAFELGGQWMQRVFGTPVTALDVDRHSVMAYSSLFEGWSRGLVNRRRAEAMLSACARFSRKRFGERAAVSLGCVGAGAFGSEPAYRDPAELARDVGLARAAGIDEIALFDLGGVMRRAPAAAWLDALVA
jgi:hypothetical protein